MSDQIAIDLFIQDFITTNIILGGHLKWESLVSRRFVEAGPATKIFRFTSNHLPFLAIGTLMALPEGDCFRIELTRPELPVDMDHRFDLLRMTHQTTHTGISTELFDEGKTVVIHLQTRNRGLINVAFVVREGARAETPLLLRSAV